MKSSRLRAFWRWATGSAIIAAAWALGEILSRHFPLPVPGPILGLAVLFLSFSAFPSLVVPVMPAGQFLLRNLPLLLYPLGAGFLMLGGLGLEVLLKIAAAIAASLVLSMVLCAYVFRYFKH